MKKINLLLLLAVVMITSVSVSYSVPPVIAHQGRIYGTDGKPKADGEYQLTIRFYDSASEYAEIKAEFTKTVMLTDGIFNVEIGGDEEELPDFSEDYWVGISLGTDLEMKPRIRLNSSPRAIYSETAAYSDEAGHSQTADTADYVRNIPGMPLGIIMTYAGNLNALDDAWIVCDGRALSSKEYPDLFRTLGQAWGDGTSDAEDNTDFNIPNLQGMFLRGVDVEGFNDPDSDTRQAIAPGGNTGAKVGSVQRDASRSPYGNDPFETSQSMNPKKVIGHDGLDMKYSTNGGNENRPINAAVYYIIKVK